MAKKKTPLAAPAKPSAGKIIAEKADQKKHDSRVSILIPSDDHKAFKLACLKNETSQKDVLWKAIKHYTKTYG